MDTKTCPVCNVPLDLKEAGYPMGSVLAHNRIHADIYACPQCGYVALFESAPEELIICPVCGHRHSAKEQCIICALNRQLGGNSAS